MSWKSLLLLIIIAAAAVWGVLELNKTPDAALDVATEQALLPEFEEAANAIDAVKVSKAGGETVAELTRNEQQWVVSSAHDYPADVDKIRTLLIDLIDARIVEQKTANPEYYERLGVDDITQEDTEGVQVELKNSEDDSSLGLIIGKLASNGGSGTYVRRSGEEQSYLIGSTVALSKDSHQWLQQPIMEVPFERIQRVSIHHPDGEILTLVKKDRTQQNLEIFNMLAGRELSYETVTNPTGSALANLRLEGVVPAAEYNFDDQEMVKAEYYTFDGLVITANLTKQDDKYYASITTRFDQEQADQFAETASGEENQTDGDNADSESDTAVAADDAQESDDEIESVKQESDSLNQTISAWVYEISQYKYESMTKRLEDLLKPAEDNTTEQSQNSNLPSLGMPTLDNADNANTPAPQSTATE